MLDIYEITHISTSISNHQRKNANDLIKGTLKNKQIEKMTSFKRQGITIEEAF